MNVIVFKQDETEPQERFSRGLVALAQSVAIAAEDAMLLDLPPSARRNIVTALLASARSLQSACEALDVTCPAENLTCKGAKGPSKIQ